MSDSSSAPVPPRCDDGLLQALVGVIDDLEAQERPGLRRRSRQNPLTCLSSPVVTELACELGGVTAVTNNLAGQTNSSPLPSMDSQMVDALPVPLPFHNMTGDDFEKDAIWRALLHPDSSRSRLSQWVPALWKPLLHRWWERKTEFLVGALQPAPHGAAPADAGYSHAQWKQMEGLQSTLAARLVEDVLDTVDSRVDTAPEVTTWPSLTSSTEGEAAKDKAQGAIRALREQLTDRVRQRQRRQHLRRRKTAEVVLLFGRLARATRSFQVLCRGAGAILQLHLTHALQNVPDTLDDVCVTSLLTHLDDLKARSDSRESGAEEAPSMSLVELVSALRATVCTHVLESVNEAWAALLLYAHKFGDAQLYNDEDGEEEGVRSGETPHDGEHAAADHRRLRKSPEALVAVVHAARSTALNESLWVSLYEWVQEQLVQARASTVSHASVDHLLQATARSPESAHGLSFMEAATSLFAADLRDGETAGAHKGSGSLTCTLVHDARLTFLDRLEAALQLHAGVRLVQAQERAGLRPPLCLPFSIPTCQRRYGLWLSVRRELSSASRASPSSSFAQTALRQWTEAWGITQDLLRVAPPNEETAWARALSSAQGWSSGDGGVSDAVTRMAERYKACMRRFWSLDEAGGGGGHVALREASLGHWDSSSGAFSETLHALACDVDSEGRHLAARLSGVKRLRNEQDSSEDSEDEETEQSAASADAVRASLRTAPITPADVYWATEFFTWYHQSCFAALRPERQRPLTRNLHKLHTVLRSVVAGGGADSAETVVHGDVSGAALAARLAGARDLAIPVVAEDDDVWSTSSSDAEEPDAPASATATHLATAAPSGETEVSTPRTAAAVLSLVAGDVRMWMCLTHTLLALQERRSAIAPQDANALYEEVVPLLVLLASARCADETKVGLGQCLAPPTSAPAEEIFFCLCAALDAELLSLPWSVEGLYLSLQRYYSLCERVVTEAELRVAADVRLAQSTPLQKRHAVVTAANAQLRRWLEQGGAPAQGRTPGCEIGTLCEEIDSEYQRLDPLYHQLASGGVTGAPLRAHLRRVTPVHWPAPCGLVLVVAAYRTLHTRLCRLRHDWEEQQRRMEDDGTGYEYVGRIATFCAQDDVVTFTALVHTVHHMVFGVTQQPGWLLRLWVGYLVHLFTSLVPPAHPDVDAVALRPSAWSRRQDTLREVDLFGDRKDWNGWRAVTFKPDSLTAQTSLRLALGEALADLAVLPLADSQAATECPSAFPLLPLTEAARHTQVSERAKAVAALQRTLPHAVCELLCLFLEIDADDAHTVKSKVPTAGARAHTKHTTNFLGIHGLVAFCRRLESNTIPGSSRDERLKELVNQLWHHGTNSARGH